MDGSKTDGKHEGLDENGFDMGWDDPLIPDRETFGAISRYLSCLGCSWLEGEIGNEEADVDL